MKHACTFLFFVQPLQIYKRKFGTHPDLVIWNGPIIHQLIRRLIIMYIYSRWLLLADYIKSWLYTECPEGNISTKTKKTIIHYIWCYVFVIYIHPGLLSPKGKLYKDNYKGRSSGWVPLGSSSKISIIQREICIQSSWYDKVDKKSAFISVFRPNSYY